MKLSDTNCTWVSFYEELADKLLSFKNDRSSLIDKLEAIYEGLGVDLPKLDCTPRLSDIDPFTVFGLFNKGIADVNRKKIAAAFAEKFEIGADLPSDFSGVPLLNNLNATFYAFSDNEQRGVRDVDNLWRVFNAALALDADESLENRTVFADAYNDTVGQFGLGWKLTMGLYWMRPRRFVSLDSRSRWYMGDIEAAGEAVSSVMPRRGSVLVRSGEEYLRICDAVLSNLGTAECPFESIAELSYAAFVESERVNEEEAAQASAADNPLGDADVAKKRWWIYSPGKGAYLWDVLRDRNEITIGWEEIGDLSLFRTKEDMKKAMQEKIDPTVSFKNAAHATWQFANEMNVGDVVYIKRGMYEIIGRGIVKSDYRFDFARGEDLCNIRDVEWTHLGSWKYPGNAPVKTLTDLTPYTQTLSQLEALFDMGEEVEERVSEEIAYPAYTKDDFLSEVFMEEEDYDVLVGLLKVKKNVILQGAPGVGKTFAAKRLAYSIMGEKDVSRVMMVQFHQSYSYEDFIEGFRPSADKFDLVKGAFYEFCKKAEEDEDRDYFFIIDEINRGNLSKIFGELFMLIESDKRGPKNTLQLLYSRELFHVPCNVYLIGMMNTADRSLAMLDYALRRRFAFVDLVPGFSTEGFASYRREVKSSKFDGLVSCVENLNEVIAEDETLGEGFCIGHSYFCGLKADEDVDARLKTIIEYEIVPLLKEYWFDEPAKVKEWSGSLRKAIK